MTVERRETLDTADGAMATFVAEPDGPTRGAVVVVMEAFGLNEHIQTVARRVADAGYHAVAPDHYHRIGPRDEIAVAPYNDVATAIELMEQLTPDGILADHDAVLDHLAADGFAPDRVAVVGFCVGGWMSLLTGSRRDLGAAVSFYGGGIVSGRGPDRPPLIGEFDTMRTPWLGLFGADDASIPMDEVEAIRQRVKDLALPTEVVVYDNAGHGFHCDARPSYEPNAAADAWRRTLQWLAEQLAT